ncbi:hypothetical protein D3C86_1982860 [compost metagenome]
MLICFGFDSLDKMLILFPALTPPLFSLCPCCFYNILSFLCRVSDLSFGKLLCILQHLLAGLFRRFLGGILNMHLTSRFI